jgi:hypothetical protein
VSATVINGFLDHFVEAGKGQISFRELMHMCSDISPEKGTSNSAFLFSTRQARTKAAGESDTSKTFTILALCSGLDDATTHR